MLFAAIEETRRFFQKLAAFPETRRDLLLASFTKTRGTLTSANTPQTRENKPQTRCSLSRNMPQPHNSRGISSKTFYFSERHRSFHAGSL